MYARMENITLFFYSNVSTFEKNHETSAACMHQWHSKNNMKALYNPSNHPFRTWNLYIFYIKLNNNHCKCGEANFDLKEQQFTFGVEKDSSWVVFVAMNIHQFFHSPIPRFTIFYIYQGVYFNWLQYEQRMSFTTQFSVNYYECIQPFEVSCIPFKLF